MHVENGGRERDAMAESFVAERLRAIVGSDLSLEIGDTGVLRVAPDSADAVALILETASTEGWAVRILGGRTWAPPDPRAIIEITSNRLDDITYLNPADLVATVQAGMPWPTLRDRLADVGAWLPVDPPGDVRTVGSVVATATAGPLRCGFGSLRDHILGMTVVTGDGKIVKPGGQVVKNVAGFEVAKLVTGSFGALGMITDVTFRLRAVPRSDITLVAPGNRDRLLAAGLGLLQRGITPAALEVFATDPDDEWTLAIRLIGSAEAVATERDAVGGETDLPLQAASDPLTLWQDHAMGCLDGPLTLRVVAPPHALSAVLDLLRHDLVSGWTSVTVFPGAVRWSGSADAERLRLFRHHAAQQECPVTIERAPHDHLVAIGHFGAYREGIGSLVSSLRTAFDPAGIVSVPLSAP
jgi:glycolate oxidase FAD binding subunit